VFTFFFNKYRSAQTSIGTENNIIIFLITDWKKDNKRNRT